MQRLEDVIYFRNVPTNESMLSDAAGLKMHGAPGLSTRKRTIDTDSLHMSNNKYDIIAFGEDLRMEVFASNAVELKMRSRHRTVQKVQERRARERNERTTTWALAKPPVSSF